MDVPLTCIDLFCGAGGLSLGLARAGFSVIHALDHNAAAVATYRANLGDHVALVEIDETTLLPPATIIVGGPPCQGFSSAGQRRNGDKRNTLVSVFASLIVRHRPLAFVFENVEGFLTAENGERVLDLLSPLVEAGYHIHLRKVNAANYGVPQHRKRVIAVGGLGWSPTFTAATHGAFGAPGALSPSFTFPRTPTLQEALSGLPVPATQPPGSPDDHYYRTLVGVDLARAQGLLPGQTMRDLPETLWHQSYTRRAFRRVMDGTPTECRGGAPAGVRRLCADAPSKAITGGALSEFIHPTENRNLTLRECARIQTFPDDFVFTGTVAQRIQLIGNAVPPSLAEAIGRQLVEDISQLSAIAEGPGRLLSFEPTGSNGMSPALEQTTRLVTETFDLRQERQEQLALWG